MNPLRQRIFLVSKRETSTIDGTFFSGGEGKGIGDNSSLLSECQTATGKGERCEWETERMWEETVKFFFLVFTDYRFSMCIFLKSVFFTIRSHLSFPLGFSFLLSVSDCSWIYIGGKKNLPLIFLVFVCFRWTKWDELEAKCCSQIILQISDCR